MLVGNTTTSHPVEGKRHKTSPSSIVNLTVTSIGAGVIMIELSNISGVLKEILHSSPEDDPAIFVSFNIDHVMHGLGVIVGLAPELRPA